MNLQKALTKYEQVVEVISNQMVIYIPRLQAILSQTETIQQKLQPITSDGGIEVRENQLLYMIAPKIGDAYFSTIVVDYEQNLLTFHQIGHHEHKIEQSVLEALSALGIEDFTPQRLAYYTTYFEEGEI